MLFCYCLKFSRKAALLLLLSCSITITKADDDDVIKPEVHRSSSRATVISSSQATAISSSRAKVIIDAKTQVSSGLKTLSVSSVHHQAEFEAIGLVVSIEPLFAFRERYLVAQAELNGAKARLKQAGQSLKRQQELFRVGIAPKRSLQEQETQGITDQALVEAGKVKLMAITNEARLLWGKTLAEWALSDKTGKLTAFLSGKQHLLQITLPANKQLSSKIDMLWVEHTGNRTKARPARLISRSTQVDNTMQGESYFFQVNADDLRVGMKVSAWIPNPNLRQTGVVVPESALVWYMDQTYVYIKTAKDGFTRRLVKEYSTLPEGYFIKEGITDGEEVVVTGGQMLLSEELRKQIPDED